MNDIATNDLTIIEPSTALVVFTTDGAIDPLLSRIRSEIDAFTPDVSTATGRKAIASMAYKVAQSKTRIDDAGKKLVAQQKEIPNKIDATRKKVRDTLDKWRDEVRAPLTAWETAEAARIDKHKARIEWFKSCAASNSTMDSVELRATLAAVQEVTIDDSCEEFISEYTMAKIQAEASLMTALAKRETYEAEQAELARLREAEAKRHAKERDEAIAREAAERATMEAAAKAEAERKAAEAAATREREASEKRELQLKLQAEQAERRAAEAEAKAKQDAEAKIAAEQAEAAKREADKAHMAKINNEAASALIANGIPDDVAKQVVTLIAQRKIPHVSVRY